ncbi:MAG: HNH endonuclease [Candidatus Sericytochromatia bacterium]|nr:HNH endonuclease [Candidatus Tanganyikabacteria bacterium]
MPFAKTLPPVPEVPVARMSRSEVRRLAHAYGHHKRHAAYRFSALMPVVSRNRIFMDDHCLDIYEWAAKFGGMTRPEVDRILALWEIIGEYDCLWRLLADGVGITKLERAAPHVTPDNAGWMAKQVESLTKPELEAFLRGLRRSLAAADQAAAGQAVATGGATVAEARPVAMVRSVSPLLPGFDPARAEPATCAAPAATRAKCAESSTDYPLAPAPATGPVPQPLPTSTPPTSTPPTSTPPTCTPPTCTPPSSPPGSSTPPISAPPVASERVPSPTRPTPPAAIRLSLELDPIGEKRVRELQDIYERLHGRPIGLGQLVSLLARWAILQGNLPSLEDLAAGGIGCAGAEGTTFDGTMRGPAAPDVAALDAAALDVAMPDAATPGAAVPETGGGAGEQAKAGRKPLPVGRKFQPRLLEVVVSIAETGWRFVRTGAGWVPVADGCLAGFLTRGQAVPLGNLHVAAIAASRDVTGERYWPVAVERYLLARSGGYCEVGDCRRRAVAAHHRKRFAHDPSHHPDDLVCACGEHHGLAQNGRFRDESLDPAAWGTLAVGEEATLCEADRQFLEVRKKAVMP